ncbi:hypothetical protein C8T65DRAFT_654537 [Cerioporus squamosus]|nr:hypothetical protein C8T65DRAFT_654537 [Cerioporus squamosus]
MARRADGAALQGRHPRPWAPNTHHPERAARQRAVDLRSACHAAHSAPLVEAAGLAGTRGLAEEGRRFQ